MKRYFVQLEEEDQNIYYLNHLQTKSISFTVTIIFQNLWLFFGTFNQNGLSNKSADSSQVKKKKIGRVPTRPCGLW